ncbi:MAG: efflux RND transporter periplasmic adaptor subunit [Saprospiraceae bacterium]|nr:efflux RND transporter periplasmic adaptor subunit [Saprospiraceae bacterium]
MEKRRKKKKTNKWLIFALIVLVLALLGFGYYQGQKKPKGIEVTIEKVEKRTIKETVSASGRIFPETEVKISSDVSGEIVELFVEEGDSVVIGQPLAKIDPDAFYSAVERGEAGLNSAKSTLANAEASIESSRAQKEQIAAQLHNAKTIHERNINLLANDVISQAEFDQSLANVLQLEANLKAALANIKSAQKSAEGAGFQVKSSEASLKELKTNLNRTSIKSPTNGIISSLSVELGERVVGTIQMTGTEMMRIANLNSMEVQVDVSENDILRVRLEDAVDIEVDAYLDKVFKGTVTEIANSASNISSATASLNTDQVTNFVVKVRIDPSSYMNVSEDGQKYPFRPGMSASVDIYTNEVEDVVSVPIQSVTVREKDEDKDDKDRKKKKSDKEEIEEVVFIKSADTVRMSKVVTGIQDDEYIQVISGVSLDDEIITGPYSAVSKKLKGGKNIRIKEDKDKDEDEDKD